MLLTRVSIQNYKSFRLSDVRFAQGFNVVVGQNNAGKTAMLEGVSLKFSSNPHRSLETRPEGQSIVRGVLRVDTAELNDVFWRIKSFDIHFESGQEFTAEATFRAAIREGAEFEFVVTNGSLTSASFPGYNPKQNIQGVLSFVWNAEQNALVRTLRGVSGNQFAIAVTSHLLQRVYNFRAERLNLGKSAFGAERILRSDASNLAQVLHNLQPNVARYRKLNEYVSAIFPDVRWVSVQAVSNAEVEIFIWSVEPESEREDLAIRLAASGTGIGQVLAILYVVITSESPQIIIIDEPQSFLHPGAVRKLIEILKLHPQHQFVVTTHSPAVITAASPNQILLVRKVESESMVSDINAREAEGLQILLSDVGARLSDVFGADRILWVEGATEELCFPRIIEAVAKTPLLGTIILGVENTGEFESRRGPDAFRIYERLSGAGALLPPSVGFIFDKEGRSETQQEDIVRQSGGKVTFLPRRLYENYLLHPNALSVFMDEMGCFPQPHGAELIASWLNERRWEPRYFQGAPEEGDRSDGLWQLAGHGANLLKDLFTAFSDRTVEYRKREFGLLLTEWIVAHDPEHFRELADLLVNVLTRGHHTADVAPATT
jgi:predicted ATPase